MGYCKPDYGLYVLSYATRVKCIARTHTNVNENERNSLGFEPISAWD